MRLERIDVAFVAMVVDIDLRSLDAAAVAALHEAWLEYPLLVFGGQHLDQDEQNAFARHFGELEIEAAPIGNVHPRTRKRYSDPDHDVVKSIRGNEGWHHDSTYMPVQAKGAVFSAEVIPTDGGDTGFADMAAAYDALDHDTKELVGERTAYHSLAYSQGRSGYLPTPRDDGSYAAYGYHDLETPLRPLVKTHPETGRTNLIVGRHAHDVVGMDSASSEAWLDELNDRATADPAHVYHHRWTAGDVVLWDNRRLMHRATPFDLAQDRLMWHTRIAGDPATESALNHSEALA